jgi:hypothetical protein
MVSRFEVLLFRYQHHCIARAGLALHLQSDDANGVQEVRSGVAPV